MPNAAQVCLGIVGLLVLYAYLDGERERVFNRFIDALHDGTLALATTALRDPERDGCAGKRLQGQFPGHWFSMQATEDERGHLRYALHIKAFIDSVRVGPFAFGHDRRGMSAEVQSELSRHFHRIWWQRTRIAAHPDESTAPWEERDA